MILTVRRQLVGSALLALAGFLTFGVIAYVTFSDLKINGARYHRITQGKDLVADVVPTVATTAIGVNPALRSSSIAAARASARIRNSASASIRRNPSCPSPSRITALSTDECACSEQ